jgi:hypothetical protein
MKRERPLDEKPVKNHRLNIRMTEEEHKIFLEKFRNSGFKTQNRFFSKLISGASISKTQATDIEHFNELKKGILNLGRMGTNLNQVSAKINSTKNLERNTALEELKKIEIFNAELRDLKKLLQTTLDAIINKYKID